MKIIESLAACKDEMTTWRRDIHAHPELGFEERRSQALVRAWLEDRGYSVRACAGTGLVADLLAAPVPKLALRADLDALPIQEDLDLPYRSVHRGVSHKCGHDGHTAMLLGAAKYLAETQNFEGQVVFIFQPAEEGIGGASAMIEDGLFQQFPCDSIFAMHNAPGLPLGYFAVRSGPMMAGGAFFDIDIEGKGAHGARPESSIDPVVVSSHLVVALQSIISRNTSPHDTAVLSITQIHSGDAYNVIPQTARISGTVRAFSAAVMSQIEARMSEIASGIAASFGAEVKVDFRNIFAPTINDPAEADYAANICADIVSPDKVIREPPLIMASEDFSFMLQQVSGCYINIGNGDGETAREVHNPGYEFNDQANENVASGI